MKRGITVIFLSAVLLLVLIPVGLKAGNVALSWSEIWDALCGRGSALTDFIILDTRFPTLITSALGCAALAVAGLLMQTCFNNPLAGPSIMGISSGASLGVAVLILAAGGAVAGLGGNIAIVACAFVGALVVLGVLIIFSASVKSPDVLLIIGILVGYLTSSIISLLNFFAADHSVQAFVVWGLGTFAGVSRNTLPLFSILTIAFICSSMLYSKAMNALLFGERYAANSGISPKRVRTGLLLLSGALTATVTAWCGPIVFVGLVVPHIARMLVRSGDHRLLLPATALTGALLGVLCQICSVLPSISSTGVIPINAITPVVGVPVIVYVLLQRRKLLYFN